MAVVAQARRDEDIIRRPRHTLQIGRQLAEVDDVRVALGRVVDHRVEVDERVVTRGVLIQRRLGLGVVDLPHRRVSAGRRFAGSGRRPCCPHTRATSVPPRRADSSTSARSPGRRSLGRSPVRSGRATANRSSRTSGNHRTSADSVPGLTPSRCSCRGSRVRSRSSARGTRPGRPVSATGKAPPSRGQTSSTRSRSRR